MSAFKVKFWGVCGSVPAPVTNADIRKMLLEELIAFQSGRFAEGVGSFQAAAENYLMRTAEHIRVYGGNTSCVELQAMPTLGGHEVQRIIFDMGTGLRSLGNSLFPEMKDSQGLEVTFCLSHVHWDHIQGLPFFGPLYVNKHSGIQNRWTFLGGTNWQKTAEVCLAGQMDAPNFPVTWREIADITEGIQFKSVYDMMPYKMGRVEIVARKLNHPQETYGYRVTNLGKVFVYATDNEPYDMNRPDPRLVNLAQDADVLVIDCQYSYDVYHAIRTSPPRYGWGHSYPEAVASVVKAAGVKHVVLFHHDPGASSQSIRYLAHQTKSALEALDSGATVQAAHEGLEIEI